MPIPKDLVYFTTRGALKIPQDQIYQKKGENNAGFLVLSGINCIGTSERRGTTLPWPALGVNSLLILLRKLAKKPDNLLALDLELKMTFKTSSIVFQIPNFRCRLLCSVNTEVLRNLLFIFFL